MELQCSLRGPDLDLDLVLDPVLPVDLLPELRVELAWLQGHGWQMERRKVVIGLVLSHSEAVVRPRHPVSLSHCNEKNINIFSEKSIILINCSLTLENHPSHN